MLRGTTEFSFPNRTIHVLCVDDEETSLMLRKGILEANGYHVTTSGSAVRAAMIFDPKTIGVAVLDYNMPGMSGAELAGRLKKKNSQIEVILLTGAVHVPQQELLSVDLLIHKSDGVQELLAAVDWLMSSTYQRLFKFPPAESQA
jgi:CheY-like chemotaxis protein